MLSMIGAQVFSTLKIMGWMGIVLFLLATVNTVCSIVYNTTDKKETFSIKRLFKGVGKTALFYVSSVFVAIAFTIIPFINEMISTLFGQALISNDMLQSVSGLGVLGTCIGVIIKQGIKAWEGIKKLGDIKGDNEEITWEVKDE